MSKVFKKLTSALLAVILAFSVFAVMPLTAGAEEAAEEINKIYFDAKGSGWTYDSIGCHIWRADGTGTWTSWGTKKELCTEESDGRWSYDLSKTGNEINPSDGKLYCVIFYARISSSSTSSTYNLIMSGACIGDEVYVTGNILSNPWDEEKTAIEAAWRNNPDCGSEKEITFSGNVVGNTLPEGETNESLLAEYLIDGIYRIYGIDYEGLKAALDIDADALRTEVVKKTAEELVNYYDNPLPSEEIELLLETAGADVEELKSEVAKLLDERVEEGALTNDEADEIKIKIYNMLTLEVRSDGTFTYLIHEDGTAEIIEYNGSNTDYESDVVIPSEIDGITVTRISDNLLYGYEGMQSVTIPSTVTEIGEMAFGYYYRYDMTEIEGQPVIIEGNAKIDGFTVYGYAGTAAEAYANENGFTFINLGSSTSSTENTYTDELTGISVTVDSDAELFVNTLIGSDTVEEAETALGDGEEIVEIYDIILVKDTVIVQPDGTATVKLPASSENLKVYRLESDSTLTDMNAVYEDGYLVFTTDHFSVYIVARQQSEELLIGDVNGDTILDVNDVTYLQKYLAHYNDSPIDESDNTQFAIADFNGDNVVDINDATAIQMKLAGYDN